MNKKSVILTLALFIVLFVIILEFDSSIVKFFEGIRGVVLNDVFSGFTFVSSGVIIFFLLTSLFLWREHKRKWVLPLWVTFASTIIVSFIFKIIVQRLRPYQIGIVNTDALFQSASHLVWDYSFPSFQAMLAFSALPIIIKEFPKLKYVWVVFATLVALSRVYFGVHFLSDVLAGACIGYLIGLGILKLEKETKFSERIYYKIIKKK
jgi:undecaprenyl-diphosphatase